MAFMKEFQPLYEAFQLFVDRCLRKDGSMLWPESNIWTLMNLRLWKEEVIDHPHMGKELNFKEKLQEQLAGAPAVLWSLTADLHYVYYLPSSNITWATRFLNIGWAAEQAGMTVPPETDPVWQAYQHGFVQTTQKYHFRFAQLHLLVLFALRLKERGNPEATLSDPTRLQLLLDEILEGIPKKGDRAVDMRHAILYLMFPARYERIISTRDKERIVERYQELIPPPSNDLDENIFRIRQELANTHPEGNKFDFYRHFKMEWKPSGRTQPAPVATRVADAVRMPEAPVVIEALRLLQRFKNLILYGPPGTGKTYWARQIANQLVAPQLKQEQSKPVFSQTVIEDLPFHITLALAIHNNNPDDKYTVPQLEELELVQARFRLYPVKHPKNMIWGYLQAHTALESQTVNISSRAEPFLFDKTQDSRWYLTEAGKEYVRSTFSDKLNTLEQGPPVTNKAEDFIRWITFHQSYAYEDFVEGLRPKTEESEAGSLTFELKAGIFRSLCSRAEEDPGNHYVMVIDEINRGNIAKVFGELMTLIEADKRDNLAIELPYSKEMFRVPANLAIIGTMNSTDRSIALLDVALRRRFAFLELLPETELLDEIEISVTEEDPLNLGNCLRILNQRISERHGQDYQIGHSYFLPLKEIFNDEKKLEALDDIWNYQVMPLLKEYFYSQGDLMRQVLPSFFEEDGGQDQAVPSPVTLHGEELVAALNKL